MEKDNDSGLDRAMLWLVRLLCLFLGVASGTMMSKALMARARNRAVKERELLMIRQIAELELKVRELSEKQDSDR